MSVFEPRWTKTRMRHLPWGFRIGRLHVTWYDAWERRCTLEGLVSWEKR